MPEYEKMYAVLCGAISDALDDLNNKSKVRAILEEALLKTEEMYITADLSRKIMNFDF